jgi:hypothetical protein
MNFYLQISGSRPFLRGHQKTGPFLPSSAGSVVSVPRINGFRSGRTVDREFDDDDDEVHVAMASRCCLIYNYGQHFILKVAVHREKNPQIDSSSQSYDSKTKLKKCDHNIGFWEKRQFFRRKL